MASINEDLRFSAVEWVAGAAAGFAEHFLMFPFDTIKTRLQSGSEESILSSLRVIWHKERLAHLYRGCAPMLCAAVPAHAAYFGVYEATKRVVGEQTNVGVAISACFATATHDVVTVPFDVVKQRMQMDQCRCYRSSYHCGISILRGEGLRALFLSLPTTIAMNIPHMTAYWLVYESYLASMRPGNTRNQELENTMDYLVGGVLAGTVASCISFPIDTIKTHLQLGRSDGFGTAWREVMMRGGMRGLFRGVLPRVLYTAPSGAITMVTYESMKKLLS